MARHTTAVEPGATPEAAFRSIAASVRKHVADDRPLRCDLPGHGHLHLDRALPCLAAYRSPSGHEDAGAPRLVDALAAHLVAPAEDGFRPGVDAIVEAVASSVADKLGAFLLLEVWTASGDGEPRPAEAPPRARFTVVVEGSEAGPEARGLEASLRRLRLRPENGGDLGVAPAPAEVRVERREQAAPEGLPSLVADAPCHRLGLEVSPFFRDPESGRPYPRVLEALRRALTAAVERTVFHFAQERTSLDVPHPFALGRRNVEASARRVDASLGEVYGAFDPLLQVTPVNTEAVWQGFRASGWRRVPELRYRPLPFDPEEVKRRLFGVPIEDVEDPLLAALFREKQEELDRQISLVRSVETPSFRWAAYQLHGTVSDDLLGLALALLRALPPDGTGEEAAAPGEAHAGAFVDAREFAGLAAREMARYREAAPDFEGGVELRDDLTAGLMVSKGVLLVSRSLRVPRHRVQALLQHEVGTHVVTYVNGLAQPFRLFAAGLAAYEGLQEGLAVLAEHLVGGLTQERMRVLAARVVAVRSLVDGAGFLDTWRLLTEEHGFRPRGAFIVALRVHRGGGLTKDALYLRGLRDLLAFLGADGRIEPLLVGKVGLGHAEVVQELVLRGVLRLPRLRPAYLGGPGATDRLDACRGRTLLDLARSLAA